MQSEEVVHLGRRELNVQSRTGSSELDGILTLLCV